MFQNDWHSYQEMRMKFVKQKLLLNFDGLPVQDNFEPIPWVSKTVTCNVLERLAFCDYSTHGQFRCSPKAKEWLIFPGREGKTCICPDTITTTTQGWVVRALAPDVTYDSQFSEHGNDAPVIKPVDSLAFFYFSYHCFFKALALAMSM